MDVGIRDLKAHLSEYLHRAARGEVVTVTERGQPLAVLAPLPGRGRLEHAADEGWAQPPIAGLVERQPVAKGAVSITRALDEDRGQ